MRRALERPCVTALRLTFFLPAAVFGPRRRRELVPRLGGAAAVISASGLRSTASCRRLVAQRAGFIGRTPLPRDRASSHRFAYVGKPRIRQVRNFAHEGKRPV